MGNSIHVRARLHVCMYVYGMLMFVTNDVFSYIYIYIIYNYKENYLFVISGGQYYVFSKKR